MKYSATGRVTFRRLLEGSGRRKRLSRKKGARDISTGCTKRIQFDGITITGVMSENNEISPNHHGSPGIRSFVPFLPSSSLSLSLPFFLPPPSIFHRLLRAHTTAHEWTRISGLEKMSRTVFESIRSLNYFVPRQRKVERSWSTSAREADSDRKFSNVTIVSENFPRYNVQYDHFNLKLSR